MAHRVTGSTADLYHIMIYMFLSPFDSDCGGKCPENVLFTGQGLLQVRSSIRRTACCQLSPRSMTQILIGLVQALQGGTDSAACCDLLHSMSYLGLPGV